MIEDILRDTRAYKEMTKDSLQTGLEKGLQEGLEKGLQEGRKEAIQGLREALLNIVKARFPQIARLTQRLSPTIEDSEVLQGLIVKMSIAQNIEGAKQYLLEAVEGAEEN